MFSRGSSGSQRELLAVRGSQVSQEESGEVRGSEEESGGIRGSQGE